MPIKYDNTNTINLSKNPILYSRTKYIEIRHHFIRDLIVDRTIFLDYICTENQLAYMFTKPLNVEWLCDLRRG